MARSKKLITKAIEKKLEKSPFGRIDGMGNKAPVICKFFAVWSTWTWYVLEGEKQANGDWLLFGWVEGLEGEYGYFRLSELQALRKFGAPAIERDQYFAEGTEIGNLQKELGYPVARATGYRKVCRGTYKT